jgi:hypothetical protein
MDQQTTEAAVLLQRPVQYKGKDVTAIHVPVAHIEEFLNGQVIKSDKPLRVQLAGGKLKTIEHLNQLSTSGPWDTNQLRDLIEKGRYLGRNLQGGL